MIFYSDIQRCDDVPFEEYLKMPGFSQSFLKNEVGGVAKGVEVTDNMRLGSMVDAILTEPSKVDYTSHLFEPGRAIALKVKQTFGNLINVFEKQASYFATANLIVDEKIQYCLRTKGRLDFLLPKHAVIDLKVTTSKPNQIKSLIDFMGYDNQLWHYGKLSEVKEGYLIIYSRPVKETFLFKIDISNEHNNFWANKIEKHGTVKQL